MGVVWCGVVWVYGVCVCGSTRAAAKGLFKYVQSMMQLTRTVRRPTKIAPVYQPDAFSAVEFKADRPLTPPREEKGDSFSEISPQFTDYEPEDGADWESVASLPQDAAGEEASVPMASVITRPFNAADSRATRAELLDPGTSVVFQLLYILFLLGLTLLSHTIVRTLCQGSCLPGVGPSLEAPCLSAVCSAGPGHVLRLPGHGVHGRAVRAADCHLAVCVRAAGVPPPTHICVESPHPHARAGS